jgi:hypothetical protein
MNWENEYNDLYLLLKSEDYDISVLKAIDSQSIQSVIIATIILSLFANSSQKALEYLNYFENETNDVNFCSYLRFLVHLLSDNKTDTNLQNLKDLEKLNPRVPQISNIFELQLLIFILQCSNNYTTVSSQMNIDEWIQSVELKISKINDYSPYFEFLQQCRLELYKNKLVNLKNLGKWSLYLISSYHLLNEFLFTHNLNIQKWYENHQEILNEILPFFFKSLLLEPYGYFRSTISNNFNKNFSKLDKSNSVLNFILELSSLKFTDLSTNPYIEFFNDSEYKIVFRNLVDLNTVKASKLFKTVKFTTLYNLFGLSNTNYKLDDLIDDIIKLSDSKKIIVKINQFDGFLDFPIQEKSEDEQLNEMFSTILPEVLERDWDSLLLG